MYDYSYQKSPSAVEGLFSIVALLQIPAPTEAEKLFELS